MTHFEGVVELGTTATRLIVAEIDESGGWKVVDSSSLPTHMGRDIFAKGVSAGLISRENLMQCLTNLNRFREQLEGWGLTAETTTVIAASALREAANRDAVIDRIFVKTGFTVTMLDGVEENRLMYLALMDSLKSQDFLDADQTPLLDAPSLVISVGGGSTEILLTEKKKIQAAHSYRMGTIVIDEWVKSLGLLARGVRDALGTIGDMETFLDEYVDNSRPWLNSELSLNRIQQFFAIGPNAKLAADLAGEQIAPKLWCISRDQFDVLVETVQAYSLEECAARFKLSRLSAQYLHIALLEYQRFLHLTRAEAVLVPQANILDGMLISKMGESGDALREQFTVQIIASAKSLTRKYHGDDKHSLHVCALAVKLFEGLRVELGLEERSRTLLEVAAILHDIGMFVHGKNHEVHSAYIIGNSEIFGLTREEKRIVERVALYHRGHRIPQQDKDFTDLPRADRIMIIKLASILRLADALDRSHRQEIKDFSLELRTDGLAIKCKTRAPVETMAVAEKADMFESVFGYRVVLE